MRKLLERQLDLYRKRDYDGFYSNFSPSFRSTCTKEQLVASLNPSLDPAKLELHDISIALDSDRARASYATTYNGERMDTVDARDPDIFVKVDGRWYDELDTHTHC